MRYGWRGRILYSPDATGGGGAAGPDLLSGGDAGAGGGSDASGSPPGGGDTGTGGESDDYADLAGDERVQAYLKQGIEKQFSHIPQDHRSPEAYQRLLQAAQQSQDIQSNPQWRAFMAAQQAAQGQQQQEQPFHTDILAALEKNLGSPMNQAQKRFFGDMMDSMAKAMESRFTQQHVEPLKQYLVRQHLDRERSDAEKLPDYGTHRDAINQVVQKYGIPYAEAYKLVMFDKRKTSPAGEAAQAPGDQDSGNASDRRSSDGERPSGATSAGHRMPAKLKPGEGRNGAAAYLRSRGIKVE